MLTSTFWGRDTQLLVILMLRISRYSMLWRDSKLLRYSKLLRDSQLLGDAQLLWWNAQLLRDTKLWRMSRLLLLRRRRMGVADVRNLGNLVSLRLLRVEELGEGRRRLGSSQYARGPLRDLLLVHHLCGGRRGRARMLMLLVAGGEVGEVHVHAVAANLPLHRW